MLGSPIEADDAVQETWLRLSGASRDIENPRAWLTTVIGRVCLNMLRSPSARRDQPSGTQLPDPVVGPGGPGGPEDDAVIADSVEQRELVVYVCGRAGGVPTRHALSPTRASTITGTARARSTPRGHGLPL
jgi:DNA-directed RNA polymerase specialized sigma24 family protein